MESYQNSMDFFLNAYRICFAVAAVAFVIALLMFFSFDIKTIFMIKTGRARQKTVDEMSERNSRTGKLREDSGQVTGERTKPVSTAKVEASTAEDLSKYEPPDIGKSSAPSSTTVEVKEEGKPGQTVLLSEEAAAQEASAEAGSDFRVIRKMIVTHTDEVIPLVE